MNIDRNDFPSNSHKKKLEKQPEKKVVKKVVKGGVKKRKKPLSKKLTETFIGEDIDNVSSYIINDVLIPAAKSTIFDMVQGGFEMLLFGERRGYSSRSRGNNKSYVSYNNYSNKRDDRRDISYRDRARHNFDDIILETRAEAQDVLGGLSDLIQDYDSASVADLYDLLGVTGNFTDNKYGWTDLRNASIRPVRGGYLVDLPRPILLT